MRSLIAGVRESAIDFYTIKISIPTNITVPERENSEIQKKVCKETQIRLGWTMGICGLVRLNFCLKIILKTCKNNRDWQNINAETTFF
jgi:hypothetical protein